MSGSVRAHTNLCPSELLSGVVSCVNPMEFQRMEPTCLQSVFMAAASSALQLAGALCSVLPAPPHQWVGG